MTIAELLAKAEAMPPAQKTNNSKYRKYTDAFFVMKRKGYTAEQMACWLIECKEIEPEKLNSCRRSISQLLKKHAPKAPVTPTPA